jgi:cytochrome c peroxidase
MWTSSSARLAVWALLALSTGGASVVRASTPASDAASAAGAAWIGRPSAQSAPPSAVPSPSSGIDASRLPVELAHLSAEEVARIARMSPLPPLPSDPTNRFADDERAAELGHLLFFDTRLSPKGVSCATCHDPERHFTDGKPLAVGVGTARRNAPTVVDSARRRWIGWDGKFDSLWSQALAPIEHPDEMGGSRGRLLEVVSADDTLRSAYEAAFGPYPTQADDHTVANVLKALGAYQRRLLSGDAPIDRFVRALKSEDEGARTVGLEELSPSARRGLATFVSKGGCYQCHRGPSFTDEEFHALGLVGANGRVPDDPARLAAIDFLQANPFNAAGAFSDGADSSKASMVRGLRRSGELFGQFRTPPLRGVTSTAPYMHDGRMVSLEEVVRFYDTLEGASPVGHHGEQVLEPLGLGEEGRADLVAFLRALTPDRPQSSRWVKPPEAIKRTANPSDGR